MRGGGGDQGQEFSIFFNGLSDLSAYFFIANMVPVRNIQEHSLASHLKPGFFSLTLLSGTNVYIEMTKRASALPLIRQTKLKPIWKDNRYPVISPNWFQLCQSCSGLCNP